MTTPKPASAPDTLQAIAYEMWRSNVDDGRVQAWADRITALIGDEPDPETTRAALEWLNTPAASAPPADGVVGYLTSRGQFYGSQRAMPQAEHATARPLTIAASAQVREAGPCPDCDNTGSVHRADGEYVGECKWHGKLAAEPAPVAQGDAKRFAEIEDLAQSVENEATNLDADGHSCDAEMLRTAAGVIRQQQATIADHARRESLMQAEIDALRKEIADAKRA